MVEFATRRLPPIWIMAGAAALIASGLSLLAPGWAQRRWRSSPYGAGNGLWSIARGALPLALFGASGYAALMGRLALPSLVAQALGPLLGAVLLARYGAGTLVACLAALALANLAAVVRSGASTGRRSESPPADDPELARRPSAAEEAVAAVALEPRDAHARWHGRGFPGPRRFADRSF